jgi:hypothetical protein
MYNVNVWDELDKMSIASVEARSLAYYAAKSGADREETIKYFTLAIAGAHGPISKDGCDWCRRVLAAMMVFGPY